MRILYFSDNHPSLSSFIYQDVEAMSKVHEVYYLYSNQFESEQSFSFKTKFISYPKQSFLSKVKWKLEQNNIYLNWYNNSFSKKLNKYIKEINPDVIHCQFAYEALKLFDNFKGAQIPIVINFRGYDASYKLRNQKYVKRIANILSRPYIHSIFVCEALRNNLLSKGIKFKNKPHIIYTGVNFEKFKTNRKVSDSRNGLKMIQIGSFTPKKGHFTTIKAFDKYLKNNPNSTLTFIGEGLLYEDSKSLVKKLKLEKWIKFLGKQNHEYIISKLLEADVFVHHSVTAENGDQEGIPNAIIEAMAMELPILATLHSGIPEAIDHGVNGLLCEENDINTFANQMEEIKNYNLLSINRERVIEQFSLDQHLKKINEVYDSLIKK